MYLIGAAEYLATKHIFLVRLARKKNQSPMFSDRK